MRAHSRSGGLHRPEGRDGDHALCVAPAGRQRQSRSDFAPRVARDSRALASPHQSGSKAFAWLSGGDPIRCPTPPPFAQIAPRAGILLDSLGWSSRVSCAALCGITVLTANRLIAYRPVRSRTDRPGRVRSHARIYMRDLGFLPLQGCRDCRRDSRNGPSRRLADAGGTCCDYTNHGGIRARCDLYPFFGRVVVGTLRPNNKAAKAVA